MTSPLSDTTPEAKAVHLRLLREMPPWRRLAMMDELNATARTLALSGLKSRHPNASEEELQRRLADLLLGPELAERAYGPFPMEWGSSKLASNDA